MEDRIWYRSYPPGVPPRIPYDEITLEKALHRSAERYPDVTALILMGKKISYRELDHMVSRFASALSHLGIKKGDKVAMVLPNLPQIVIATYAAWRMGAVVVMNNPLYTERELEHQFNDSGSTIAIVLDLLVPRILSLKNRTPIQHIVSCHIRDYLPFPLKQLFPLVKKKMHRAKSPGEDVIEFLDLMKTPAAAEGFEKVEWLDQAALLYTGGTTGLSKGVVLTHQNLSCNVQQFGAPLNDLKDGNEMVIGNLPFFHSAGFTAVLNHCIFRGFTTILVPKPEPDAIIDVIKKYKPAALGGVPTTYVGLLNHPNLPPKSDLSFIKGSISGAAPCALDTLKSWNERVGSQIVEVYGMTEMSPVTHANPWGGVTKPGSVGIPLPDTDCRVVDIDTGLMELPQGESGEILLKGPQQMTGYYNRPEETEASLKDGWFHTGDIGYMDEDGYLFIVDRKKDMIISGGFNVYPRDIDEVLFDHPKIREACAIGLPDQYRGETVKAFIVLQEGETMTKEDVISYCREKLAPYKVPREVQFMDDLPKSAIGKVLRRALKERDV